MDLNKRPQTGTALKARLDDEACQQQRCADRRRWTDEELIVNLASGDHAAFKKIFDRYRKPIYNFIRKQLDGNEYVEDLTQEVFMRVFKSAKTFNISNKFSSWIYTIAQNEVKRHWRRSGSHQALSLNEAMGDEGGRSERGDKLEDLRLAPASATEQLLFRRTLKLLIDRLPEKQRTVVLLKVYRELKFEEIAKLCDSPLSSVLSRMRYALSKLRRWLGIAGEGSSSIQHFSPPVRTEN